MGFKLQDEKHFVNYINQMLYESQELRLSDFQKAKLIEFYLLCEKYGKNYHNQLTYNLKFNGEINIEPVAFPSQIVNSEIKQVCINNNNTGLYILTNDKNEPFYVGKSKNLYTRYLSSCRKINDVEIVKVFFMFMPYVNTHILEPYYIMTYKPMYNNDFVFENNKDLIQINHKYKLTQPFYIYTGENQVYFNWGDFNNQYIGLE
jgi:hypothetical protein